MHKIRILRLDFILGFLLPLPIFLDIDSPILLANNMLAEGGIAFPISLFVIPIAILLFIERTNWRLNSRSILITLLVCCYCFWIVVLGVSSLPVSNLAIMFSVQWLIPFLWMPYFSVILKSDTPQILVFFKGFYYGVFFSVSYIFLNVILEIKLYGSLLDAGRLTQNKIFPGQYQLYIYTPTILAYGTLFVNWLFISKYILVNRIIIFIINLFCCVSLVSLGAREGIIIYIFGIYFIVSFFNVRRIVAGVIFGTLTILLVIGMNNYIHDFNNKHEIRLLKKIIMMSHEEKMLAGRDYMAMQYIEVIKNNLIKGSGMLPPNRFSAKFGVNAQSAHNYYIDVFAWSGLIGFILIFLMTVLIITKSLRTVLLYYRFRPNRSFKRKAEILKFGNASCVILFFCVSNMINVPLRQPLTGPIAILFISILYSNLKHESA